LRNNRNARPAKEGQPKSQNTGNTNRRQGARPNAPTGKAKIVKTMDVALLTKEAMPLENKQAKSEVPFSELPLSARLQDLLRKKGYTHPTPIQVETIKPLLEGRDIMGIAQTGTGKTAAFLLPLIERMTSGQSLKTLVLVPTRELALQVHEEFRSLTEGMRFDAACFIGGTNLERDLNTLRRPMNLIVGTPGRLLDLANRNALKLGSFNVLILDEFDRMLDMGFAPDVNRITKMMTGRKQTLLFSATVDKTQKKLIDGLLHNPVEVKVSTGEATGDHIDQQTVRIGADQNKFKVLVDMLSQPEFDKVLLFAETKRGVSRLTVMLKKAGIQAEQIHGDKSQNSRQNALEKFKSGKIQVLVATDVAARGIDVSDVTHVINYQVPRTYDSYVHRIGRTGRAGKAGKAYTFVD
jgi:ATP-dependent RNA helicase RhlE